MLVRLVTLVGVLGCAGLSLGCAGHPRVVVITSTMVGLEAKPPMGDAQPNPSVSLGYRRAEMTLVPVCQVTEYAGSKDLKNKDGTESKEVKKKDGPEETSESEKSNPRCPPKTSKDADAYAAMGSFQMAHNWFGPLNIRQFIATGMAARDLVDPKLPKVHVIGNVKNPSRFTFKKGLTVKDVIEMAGGKTEKVVDEKVRVLRQGKEGQKEELLSGTDLVSPDDTIFVPGQQGFTVTGAVKNPGPYPIESGLKGKDAIEKAGGYIEKADQEQATIRRRQNDQDVTLTNISDTIVVPDDTIHVPEKPKETKVEKVESTEMFSLGGAVKKPGSYPYAKGLTIRRAIELAGGRAENAKTGVVNVSRVMDGQNYTDIAKDLAPVLPNDVIYVEIDKPSTNKRSCFLPCQPQ